MPNIEDMFESFLDSDTEEFLKLLDDFATVEDKDGSFIPVPDVFDDMIKYFIGETL